jgi:polyisoprenyl-phosphate glycosyltransferase
MLAGLTYAEGDCVVIMDADLQHPPELIPKMIQYYHEGYDQVIAKRNRHGDKKSKSLAANLYYKFVNKIVDVDLTDGIGDFRLLSRKAVNALLSINEYNRFSKGLFSWVGFKKKIIEYENSPRIAGETKWNFKKLLSYGIDGITSFNNKPLRICFMLGAISILLGFFYILWTFIDIIRYGITVPGYFTIILAILIIGGVQLISIGVIGEYIGKIYYEVKKRPHFLIDKTNIVEKKQNDKRDRKHF